MLSDITYSFVIINESIGNNIPYLRSAFSIRVDWEKKLYFWRSIFNDGHLTCIEAVFPVCLPYLLRDKNKVRPVKSREDFQSVRKGLDPALWMSILELMRLDGPISMPTVM